MEELVQTHTEFISNSSGEVFKDALNLLVFDDVIKQVCVVDRNSKQQNAEQCSFSKVLKHEA